MLRFFYAFLFYLAVPLVLLRLLFRSIKEPEYRKDIWQRFGGYDSARKDVIWIHAVSAGETIAATPLVKRLIAAGNHCIVTNMTPTGRDRVRTLLHGTVENCYAPYDLPGSIQRFIENNRPRMLITVDTELWPNTIHRCNAAGIPVVLVNGRMSERSARGYQRIASVSKPMLQSTELILTQTEQHASRFKTLGARDSSVRVTGSIKFDGQYAEGHAERVEVAEKLIGGRPVILGASTHEGEEAALLAAFEEARKSEPELLLILVPRHTHRTDRVATLCSEQGYQSSRLSQLDESVELPIQTQVLIVDVMGVLESYYPLADIAFVGGSLAPVGGHNLLEAVRSQTAVVMGPHLDNIEDITSQFEQAGGMVIVSDANDLQQTLKRLMTDTEKRTALVEAANRVFELNRGSLDRTVNELLEVLQRP